ncbi:hypothetical protein, partial [Cytobacillus pseudoceanisediminis]|uniref:hypothetical protein n=1 Tax=Cytobacillus pseudoceanisediminis TaxID=3051614 RepID=UPI003C2CB3BB
LKAFGFGLHASSMATISTLDFWFWASCELHGDHFLSRLLVLGFMRALWRPFSLKAFGFGLHASSMATISTLDFWFWASCELHGDRFISRLLISGFMGAP